MWNRSISGVNGKMKSIFRKYSEVNCNIITAVSGFQEEKHANAVGGHSVKYYKRRFFASEMFGCRYFFMIFIVAVAIRDTITCGFF